MSFFSLISTVIVGVLFFIIYFGLSNFILDLVCKFKSNSVALENSVRAIIFIAPAFLVLFMFILYPVFETVRLSFYDKFGREFVGWNNYLWALNDPNFRRSILNNLGWLLIVPTLSTFFGLVIANLTDKIWWGTIAKYIIFMPMAISFVGAGVIWKFIYEYRGPDNTQFKNYKFSNEIYLGIRPEHIHPNLKHEIEFNINIDLIENLGSDKIIYGLFKDNEIRIRTSEDLSQNNTGFSFNKNKIVFFDSKKNKLNY